LRQTLLVRDPGEVGAVDAHVDAGRSLADEVARLLEGGNAARRHVEVTAFGGQRAGDRETDPLARPGDERAFALQLQVHSTSSLESSA
jgi:hypothetical protein